MNFHFSPYQLHLKGWMATKFTRPQPTLLSLWGAMLQAFHKLHSKLKTISELKSALQQIWDDLPQTTINKAINDFCKRLKACASAGGEHFEHMIWTLYRNISTEFCLLFKKKFDKLCVLTHCLLSNSKSSCWMCRERSKFTQWLRLIRHNFVKFRDNWIKFCIFGIDKILLLKFSAIGKKNFRKPPTIKLFDSQCIYFFLWQ